MKQGFQFFLFVLLLFIGITSCNKCSSDENWLNLTNEEKKTLEQFSKTNNQGLKDIIRILQLSPKWDPITEMEAGDLYNTYLKTRADTMQKILGTRYSYNTFQDTKSIWIPVDSLLKYCLAIKSIGGYGTRIVFGGYEFDISEREPHTGRFPHKKSGRLTLFFVATKTIDSITLPSGKKRYIQKDTIDSRKNYYALNLYNHGDLCPDVCDTTMFK